MKVAKIIPLKLKKAIEEELRNRGYDVKFEDVTILECVDKKFKIIQKAKNDDFLVIIHKDKIFIHLPL